MNSAENLFQMTICCLSLNLPEWADYIHFSRGIRGRIVEARYWRVIAHWKPCSERRKTFSPWQIKAHRCQVHQKLLIRSNLVCTEWNQNRIKFQIRIYNVVYLLSRPSLTLISFFRLDSDGKAPNSLKYLICSVILLNVFEFRAF